MSTNSLVAMPTDRDQQRGWKFGFGSPSGLQLLGIEKPLIGYLLNSGELANEHVLDVQGWTGPAIEAEIAVRLNAALPGNATPEQVRDCIDAFLPAFEIVDLDHVPENATRIIEGNIFQRHYILGADLTVGWGDGPESLSGRVKTNNAWSETVTDVQEITGDYLTNLAHLATIFDDDQRLSSGTRAGDIILLGSIVPPIRTAPGDSFEFETLGGDKLTMSFAA